MCLSYIRKTFLMKLMSATFYREEELLKINIQYLELIGSVDRE